MVSLFRSSDIKSKYEIGEVLGTGNFAEVRKGKNKQTGENVAVKVLEIGERSNLPLIKREIDILGKMKHPNIIHMIDVFESSSPLKKHKVWFFLFVFCLFFCFFFGAKVLYYVFVNICL
jgi:serine/threonine protein kinase